MATTLVHTTVNTGNARIDSPPSRGAVNFGKSSKSSRVHGTCVIATKKIFVSALLDERVYDQLESAAERGSYPQRCGLDHRYNFALQIVFARL